MAIKATYGSKGDVPPRYEKLHIKTVVRIPAGECPFSLREMSPTGDVPFDTHIIEWFDKIRNWGLRGGTFYSADAIAYWAAWEFDPNGGEYDYINTVIMEWATHLGEYPGIRNQNSAE